MVENCRGRLQDLRKLFLRFKSQNQVQGALNQTRYQNERENLEVIEAAPYEPVGRADSVSVERVSANVIISGVGLYTAETSKIVHEIRPNLSVFDVNGILQNLPATIVEDISADKAKEIKGRLEAAGCTVELILGD